MPVAVTMPKIGLTMTEAVLVRWLAAEGDQVAPGQIIAEIETEKSTVELESPAGGKLGRLIAEPGTTIPVAETMGWILGEKESLADLPAASQAQEPVAAATATEKAQGKEKSTQSAQGQVKTGGETRSTPAARRLAKELGVDLATVQGTGPDGSIQKDDVLKAAGQKSPAQSNGEHEDGGRQTMASATTETRRNESKQAQTPAQVDRETLLKMYSTMRLIRTFEDNLHALFAAGEVPGFVHLYAGEEAIAAGVMAALRPDDYIASTHRGHAHCIAKGIDLKAMMAELYGRVTGICKGKGGSMHIGDGRIGLLGTNGIVAAGLPLASGAALSAKVRKSGQVAVSFFGDGATNQGGWHEAINMAAVLDLPCLFVCENNRYADTTSTDFSMRIKDVAERAAAYGIPGRIVDGQNVVEVYQAAQEAVARARAGKGPTLIEAKTYRYYGHFEGDNLKYRSEEEVEPFRQRDPLKVFMEKLAGAAGIAPDELAQADKRAQEQVQEAIEFARKSPFPPVSECYTDVYEKY